MAANLGSGTPRHSASLCVGHPKQRQPIKRLSPAAESGLAKGLRSDRLAVKLAKPKGGLLLCEVKSDLFLIAENDTVIEGGIFRHFEKDVPELNANRALSSFEKLINLARRARAPVHTKDGTTGGRTLLKTPSRAIRALNLC